MQQYSTYELRRIAHETLTKHGPMTLNNLAKIIGCPKEMLRYAIESAVPFDAMFRKRVDGETIYEAVPIEEPYGGKDLY